MASLSHFPSPAAVRAKQSRKEREQQYLPRRQGPNKGALEDALVPLHIYGDTAHVHAPYKSVTGRHTYVIYLMFFNIHAYLGFIQFIKFSVWPAEKRKTEADVRRPPPFKRSPTFLLGNASVATARGLPWPGLALPPQGGLSSQVPGVFAAASHPRTQISSKTGLSPDWKPPTGRSLASPPPRSPSLSPQAAPGSSPCS